MPSIHRRDGLLLTTACDALKKAERGQIAVWCTCNEHPLYAERDRVPASPMEVGTLSQRCHCYSADVLGGG
jgi:hypothetical protein